MTKVLINENLLAYQIEMAKLVRKVVRAQYITGVQRFRSEDPPLHQVDLLPPPRIEMIDLASYKGHMDDLILFMTSDDFGIVNLHVIIKDEHGNIVESGSAGCWIDAPDLWHYLTSASVPSGTSVIVSAFATDTLGGIGALSERITVNHDT